MSKQHCSLLITDLDNTLWNWLEIWFASFSALLAKTHQISGVPIPTLEGEIKSVHQRHQTSEYALLLEELPSLQALHPKGDIVKIYDDAIHAHRSARKATLKLYSGVRETLEFAKAQGAVIVGYTESMAFYTADRLRKTELDHVLDYLYSAPDHEFPAGMTSEQLRKYPADYYVLARTEHRHTPRGAIKPQPELLLQIVKDMGTSPDEAIYIGDNLMKDVVMAQHAGICDVWAKYGQSHNQPEYEQLKRVTHWTPQAVDKESALKPEDVRPRHTIMAFGELKELFAFQPLRRSA